MLVGGSAKIKLDDEVIELELWDAIHVSADDARLRGGSRVHSLRAPNTENGDAELASPNWWTDT